MLEGSLACVTPLVLAVKERMELEQLKNKGRSSHSTWTLFHQSLGALLRGRIPDPHTLLALHASLERKQDDDAPRGAPRGSNKKPSVSAAAIDAEDDDFIALSAGGLDLTGSKGGNKEALSVANDGNEAELLDLEASLFEDCGDGAPTEHRKARVLLYLIKVGRPVIPLLDSSSFSCLGAFPCSFFLL